MAEPWWKLWPGRLEYELAELDKHGIRYEFDSDTFDKGRVVLQLRHTLNGEELELTARFPESYPRFRFEVSADNLELDRHQNPFEKNLCLIGQSTRNWDPQNDTLAKFIIEQLPIAIESAQGGNSDLEEQQGEPISEFYPKSGYMIFIDSAWQLDPALDHGVMRVGINQVGIGRSTVLDIRDAEGNILAETDQSLQKSYPDPLKVQWVRSEQPIKIGDPKQFYEYLLETYPHLQEQRFDKYDSAQKFHYSLIGVVFPEEVKYKTVADGWVFVLMRYTKHKGRNRYSFVFVRAARAGRQDMLERIPTVSFMQDKVLAVAGLGSIGAPSVLEFARMGVKEIRILDHDFIEPGTTVRWPFGFSAVGMFKTDALATHIAQHFPYTKVVTFRHRIGEVPSKNAPIPEKSESEIMDEFLDDADLVYDATAEVGIHNFISDLANQKGIPYIIALATQGAWGGEVARFFPDTGPCWICFERAHSEKKIPLPPTDPQGLVQPVACVSPTFTGTNFDLQELALMGVRLAVSTLSQGRTIDYPVVDWNFAQLSLRESDGTSIPPKWDIIQLSSYPECICANRS